MGKNSGLAILALGLLYLMKDGKFKNGNGADHFPTRATKYVFLQPQTTQEAEVATQEAIHHRKIVVHKHFWGKVPTIPTTSQIQSKALRVAEIDERVPDYVKAKWGSTQAVQIQEFQKGDH